MAEYGHEELQNMLGKGYQTLSPLMGTESPTATLGVTPAAPEAAAPAAPQAQWTPVLGS